MDKPTCQVTMGQPRNYFKCGKPAKFKTTGDKPPGSLLVCGIHAKHRKVIPLA